MLRPSPNHGTQRLPNDDDDGVQFLLDHVTSLRSVAQLAINNGTDSLDGISHKYFYLLQVAYLIKRTVAVLDSVENILPVPLTLPVADKHRRDNGRHEDSSICDCGDGEHCPLRRIWQSQHKDLSTTIDNAGTMGLMRTAQYVTVVMESTVHYVVFGSHSTKICQRQSTTQGQWAS